MVATTEKPRLAALYEETVRPKLLEEFELSNVFEAPSLSKIILNCGIGRFLDTQKLKQEIADTVTSTLSTITGQRPVMVLARKSVSNFKVREGSPSAYMVTLRGDRMWHFLDRLINLAVPRIKDFRGLSDTSFDGAGNYSMGLTEQAVWPEINMAEVNFTHGMNINLVFDDSTPERSRYLLDALGMPFRRDEN